MLYHLVVSEGEKKKIVEQDPCEVGLGGGSGAGCGAILDGDLSQQGEACLQPHEGDQAGGCQEPEGPHPPQLPSHPHHLPPTGKAATRPAVHLTFAPGDAGFR